MRTPYKVEFFTNKFAYVSRSVIAQPQIDFDYLTLESTDIVLPVLMEVKQGNYAHVTDIDGTIVYQGIVQNSTQENGITTVSLLPLLSVLNVNAYADVSTLAIIEDWLETALKSLYAGTDTTQNITGFTVVKNTSTSASMLLNSNINNLLDIALVAFKKYGVVLEAVINPQAKTFTITIEKKLTPTFTVESDLDNIIEKTFSIEDSYNALNKITLIDARGVASDLPYYLHTDGTISTTDEDRISPVVFDFAEIDSDDFAGDAAIAAADALTPDELNNLIEITVKNTDNLIKPLTRKIGDRATIYKGTQTYTSILTGYRKTAETITLIFGAVRLELTKKLLLEKRGIN